MRGARTRSLGAGLGALALALAPLLGPAPALAHAELISASPADGAVVDEFPPSVTLTFSEAVATPAYVVVSDQDGRSVTDGEARVVDGTVTQPTVGAGEGGEYTVDYRVVSADGHPVNGTVGFEVDSGSDAPAAASSTPPVPETEGFWSEHGQHVALAAAGLLAGAALLGAGMRQRD